MSWTYWGIIIGLAALVVMLIACIRLLSPNGSEERQGSGPGAAGLTDQNPQASTIHKRAA